jgi:hypothetical protein
MKHENETTFQEIFVKVKVSPEQKVDTRSFAWRQINFNKLWTKDVKVNDSNEVSFTSEFNAEFSKDEIRDFIINKSSMTCGEGIVVTFLKIEVVEIKEEAEIYSL